MKVAFERRSPFSGKINTQVFEVTKEQLDAFESGVHIQDAFPHLSVDDREFIMTGILPDEWDNAFGEEE